MTENSRNLIQIKAKLFDSQEQKNRSLVVIWSLWIFDYQVSVHFGQYISVVLLLASILVTFIYNTNSNKRMI